MCPGALCVQQVVSANPALSQALHEATVRHGLRLLSPSRTGQGSYNTYVGIRIDSLPLKFRHSCQLFVWCKPWSLAFIYMKLRRKSTKFQKRSYQAWLRRHIILPIYDLRIGPPSPPSPLPPQVSPSPQPSPVGQVVKSESSDSDDPEWYRPIPVLPLKRRKTLNIAFKIHRRSASAPAVV